MSFDDAFPQLVSVPDFARSADFADVIAFLQFVEESASQRAGEIKVPGAALPIAKETIFIIVPVVVVIQAYLLATVLMAIEYRRAYRRRPAAAVLWIALFKEGYANCLWIISQGIPPASILFAFIGISFDAGEYVFTWSIDIGITQVFTVIFFFVSTVLMIATGFDVRKLRLTIQNRIFLVSCEKGARRPRGRW